MRGLENNKHIHYYYNIFFRKNHVHFLSYRIQSHIKCRKTNDRYNRYTKIVFTILFYVEMHCLLIC